MPVGGNHLTFDLARELVTTVPEAERIKTLYGTLVNAASNGEEIFSYPVAGGDDGELHQASKALVREIAKPRIDGLIDLVFERLDMAGVSELAERRVVLTGGASQMLGLDQAWSARLGCTTRIGRPLPIGRMPESVCSPAFSTAIGLVSVGAEPGAVSGEARSFGTGPRERGYFGRVHRWISESF